MNLMSKILQILQITKHIYTIDIVGGNCKARKVQFLKKERFVSPLEGFKSLWYKNMVQIIQAG